MERLRPLNPGDALQRRDLGVALLRADQPGRAIDHLNAYLEAGPDAEDSASVRQILGQARALVARWN
jgi:regulator of sirC expression with transglutaminase-like and TPR domain